MKKEVKRIEVKINIKNTKEEYINQLILGLVRSGYEAYLDYEKEHVCFTGWKDELIEEINE